MRNSMKHAEHDGIKTSRRYCDIKISSRLGTCTDCLRNYTSEKGESRLMNSPTKTCHMLKTKKANQRTCQSCKCLQTESTYLSPHGKDQQCF